MQAIFARIPEILLAYQFGSTVKRPEQPAADLDIALCLKEDVDPERRLEIQCIVADQIGRAMKQPVDVALLNGASAFFVYQVLKYGRLLYGDHARHREYVVAALNRYFDYLPLHRFFVDRMEKRLGVTPHG